MITTTQAVVVTAGLFAAAGFLVWGSIQLSRIDLRDDGYGGQGENAGDDKR